MCYSLSYEQLLLESGREEATIEVFLLHNFYALGPTRKSFSKVFVRSASCTNLARFEHLLLHFIAL
jgi:hypothetical protein